MLVLSRFCEKFCRFQSGFCKAFAGCRLQGCHGPFRDTTCPCDVMEWSMTSMNHLQFLFCFLYFLQNPRIRSLISVFLLFCSRDLPISPAISRDLPRFAGYLPGFAFYLRRSPSLSVVWDGMLFPLLWLRRGVPKGRGGPPKNPLLPRSALAD